MRWFANNHWRLLVLVLLFPATAWAQREMGYGYQWYDYRLVQHALAALVGGITGVFLSQKLAKFRWWIMVSCLGLGAFALVITSAFFGNIAFFIAAACGTWSLLQKEKKGSSTSKYVEEPTTFGSAKWATLGHLTAHKLVGQEGFVLGHYTQGVENHPLHYTGDRHLLTVAPTRSGKGVSAIIPNLLTYQGSVIVIDPKGENARITNDRRGAGNRKKNILGLGQTVRVVDPWGITGLPIARFNPMDWLDPKDEDISENAMMLADSIVTPHPGARDQFWDEEAKALLMGFLLYVALDEREQRARNLGRVRDIICLGEDSLKDILLQMIENTNSIVSSTAERTLAKEAKLRSNVLASLQAHTHFLDSPRIRASLEASDFRFENMKNAKMTVYLVLPADRLETFGRWLRILVQQAITVNARNIDVKPDKPILFLLDEMASLGRLSMVEQAFGLMAGFGMQLWGIVQDLSQLERIYDKGWETFIGNSGVVQYFGSRDHRTAEYFSKLCGVTTIKKTSFTDAIARTLGWSSSSSTGPQGGSSTSGSSSSTTHSDSTTEDVAQRHLAFPDELMVLRDNKQLLLIENFNPIRAKKILWHKDEKLKALGINLHGAQEEEKKADKPSVEKMTRPAQEQGGSNTKNKSTGQSTSTAQRGKNGESERNENHAKDKTRKPGATPQQPSDPVKPEKMTRQEACQKYQELFRAQGGKIERDNGKLKVTFKDREWSFSGVSAFNDWLLELYKWDQKKSSATWQWEDR